MHFPKPRRLQDTARIQTMHVTRGDKPGPLWDPQESAQRTRHKEQRKLGSSDTIIESDMPTNTHAKNITHAEHNKV
jgi:hypothetical protein